MHLLCLCLWAATPGLQTNQFWIRARQQSSQALPVNIPVAARRPTSSARPRRRRPRRTSSSDTLRRSSLGATPCVIGVANSAARYREDRSVRIHDTPFEQRCAGTWDTGPGESYRGADSLLHCLY